MHIASWSESDSSSDKLDVDSSDGISEVSDNPKDFFNDNNVSEIFE